MNSLFESTDKTRGIEPEPGPWAWHLGYMYAVRMDLLSPRTGARLQTPRRQVLVVLRLDGGPVAVEDLSNFLFTFLYFFFQFGSPIVVIVWVKSEPRRAYDI